jgi:putative transcriptional regulator
MRSWYFITSVFYEHFWSTNDKLFALLKEKGYTTYRIRQEKLIGQATMTAIKNGTGGLDAKTIARLCETFDCRPGDLMEYLKN